MDATKNTSPSFRSPARSAASRANGAKSHGPRTASGKDKSSLNAVRHALNSTHTLLPGEDANVYEQFMEAWFADLAPASEPEAQFVALAADAAWRLERLGRIEHGGQLAELEEEMKKTPEYTLLALTERALQALRAMAFTMEARPVMPMSMLERQPFTRAAVGVIDILREAEVVPTHHVDQFESALMDLDGQSNADSMAVATAALKKTVDEIVSLLESNLETERAAVSKKRERLAAQKLLLDDRELKKIAKYRSMLETSLSRDLDALRGLRQDVQAARQNGDAARAQAFAVKLRVVK